MPIGYGLPKGPKPNPFAPQSPAGLKSFPGNPFSAAGATGAAAGKGLAELQPHEAINVRFQLPIPGTNTPQRAPGFAVAPGLTVTLLGWNGSANNAQNVYFADAPHKLGVSGQHWIAPGESLEFPVDDLSQIWFQGTAADGLLITVTGVAVG